ncbi:MAG: corrinoid protein [Deltaproteobacteria bacterium]|nr:corrinoid protein [Deltaproteobacteria bacterium]MBW1992842.1 corrinoid protein [Deltaproteobacteria bacterium]MBW2152165.1 corrinoid protein [Deltaproteobacteria bacterium]
MAVLDEIKEATIAGNRDKTVEAIDKALTEGISAADIIQKALIEAMSVVGEKFKNNEIYVPEMLIAARAMKSGLEKLKPLMVGEEVKSLATVVLGTVKGDLHDIGKNLVGIMMEGAGMKVIDLGVDIAPEKFAEAVKNENPEFLGMSALLTTTMPAMKETIAVLDNEGIRGNVKVLVGGAPVTQKFADEIGADGYAENAAEVVDKVKAMLS